jgi:tRNA threonylcarbamoyl adenosine modification protein YjeE
MAKKKSLEWQNCSEEELRQRIRGLAPGISAPGTLILLEGEMGAGKSSFARALLCEISKGAESRGSPTFPLVQQYRADRGHPVYHIDLYRLRSEEELLHSGIEEQIEDRSALVLVEWSSKFPEYFETITGARARRNVVRVGISGEGSDSRTYAISIFMSSSPAS